MLKYGNSKSFLKVHKVNPLSAKIKKDHSRRAKALIMYLTFTMEERLSWDRFE